MRPVRRKSTIIPDLGPSQEPPGHATPGTSSATLAAHNAPEQHHASDEQFIRRFKHQPWRRHEAYIGFPSSDRLASSTLDRPFRQAVRALSMPLHSKKMYLPLSEQSIRSFGENSDHSSSDFARRSTTAVITVAKRETSTRLSELRFQAMPIRHMASFIRTS